MLAAQTSFAAVALTNADPYVEGEALVKFRGPLGLARVQEIVGRHAAGVIEHFPLLAEQTGRAYAHIRSSTLSTAALLAELQRDPLVEIAEPNYIRHACELRVPGDPYFSRLWGLRNTGQLIDGLAGNPGTDIGFLKAWGLARTATNEVVVGIIDSGLDYTHPDLAPNVWTNRGEIAGNNIDDDGNGYKDDLHGYNFAGGNANIQDSGVHGTHVAGTVAASGNNALGVIGVDFQAHVMGLKVSNNGTDFLNSSIINALQYATAMKNRGVNLVALNASYGGSSYSATERDAIQAAANAGIILCAAAGNDTNNNNLVSTYPASYRLPNMIVVAATDSKDELALFSNYGATTVDLGAPGVSVFSTTPVSKPQTNAYVQKGNVTFEANPIEFCGLTPTTGLTGMVYDCGLGNSGNFPSGVKSNIALIQRGSINFSVKVNNAITAGARAAIIYNNSPGNFWGTLGSAGKWIPAIGISQADGLSLLGSLPTQAKVVTIVDPSLIYQFMEGTSMAAPHVSAAVAFAALNFPNETISQRIQRILTNTTPVMALQGKTVTGGRLNLARMVDTDSNGLPDWWELMYFGHLTGTSGTTDPDGDGASNLAEWLAGTIPTNSGSYLALKPPGKTGTISLQWPSSPGRYYRLLRSTNLLTGFNQVVLTNIAATPPLNTISDYSPAAGRPNFYRLEVEP